MEFGNLLKDSSDTDQVRDSTRASRSARGRKRRKISYLSPSLILKVFPDVPAEVLCQIAELDPLTPTDILNLVPDAKAADIAKFFDLVNGRASPSPTPGKVVDSLQPVKGDSSLVAELNEDLVDDADGR